MDRQTEADNRNIPCLKKANTSDDLVALTVGMIGQFGATRNTAYEVARSGSIMAKLVLLMPIECPS